MPGKSVHRVRIIQHLSFPNNRLSSGQRRKKKVMVKRWVEDSFDIYLSVPLMANHMSWATDDPGNYAPTPQRNLDISYFYIEPSDPMPDPFNVTGSFLGGRPLGTSSDGLLDTEEIFGTYGYISDPHNSNSDWEGDGDFDEVKGTSGYKTDPWEADTDSDYIQDKAEITGVFGYKTSPVNPDSDGDNLIDGIEVEGWTACWIPDQYYLELVCEGMKSGQDVSQYIFTAEVKSSPKVSDTDNDGLNDYREFLQRSIPTDPNTDQDGYMDGQDENATLYELYKPDITMIDKQEIAFPGGGNLKEVMITYTVYDPSGLSEVQFWTGESELVSSYIENPQTVKSKTYTDHVFIGLLDAFDGESCTIKAYDKFYNEQLLTLKQQTLGGAIASWITEEVIKSLGPMVGGYLMGCWQALKETITSIPDLIMSIGGMFAGSKAMGDAIGAEGLMSLARSMLKGIDAICIKSAPLDWQTDAAKNGTYRWSWALGYVISMVTLAIVTPAMTAKLVTKGIESVNMATRVVSACEKLNLNVGALTSAVNTMVNVASSKVFLIASFIPLGVTFVGTAIAPQIFGDWLGVGLGLTFTMLAISGAASGLKQIGFTEKVRNVADGMATTSGRTDDLYSNIIKYTDNSDDVFEQISELSKYENHDELFKKLNAQLRNVENPNAAKGFLWQMEQTQILIRRGLPITRLEPVFSNGQIGDTLVEYTNGNKVAYEFKSGSYSVIPSKDVNKFGRQLERYSELLNNGEINEFVFVTKNKPTEPYMYFFEKYGLENSIFIGGI